MAKRKNQTAQDISELASRFRAVWNEGQVLKLWLRTHGTEILERAKSGQWSWENLGRAMTEAGITYQTGTPWTGENLRRNLLRAQQPGKRELKLSRGGGAAVPQNEGANLAASRQQDNSSPVVAASEEAPQASPSLSDALRSHEHSVSVFRRPASPEFEVIRRAPNSGNAPLELATLRPARARRNLSPEELHDIALGRSAKR
jgi:hypothetical protein